jgi:hypothetical protein
MMRMINESGDVKPTTGQEQSEDTKSSHLFSFHCATSLMTLAFPQAETASVGILNLSEFD